MGEAAMAGLDSGHGARRGVAGLHRGDFKTVGRRRLSMDDSDGDNRQQRGRIPRHSHALGSTV